MKTLVMYNQFEDTGDRPAIIFFEVEGDHRDLDGIIINCTSQDEADQAQKLLDLCYGPAGEFLPKWTKEPTKDWDFFVSCGFAL